MSTKNEWKAAAERRLVENLALRTIIEQMDQVLRKRHGRARIRALYKLVRVAREVGR
jgi:hypothetical protein